MYKFRGRTKCLSLKKDTLLKVSIDLYKKKLARKTPFLWVFRAKKKKFLFYSAVFLFVKARFRPRNAFISGTVLIFPSILTVISPRLITEVANFMRRTVPLGRRTRTFWMFARNFRLVCPVVLRPTPPFFLGKPRRAILLPLRVSFPDTSHLRAIFLGLPTREEPEILRLQAEQVNSPPLEPLRPFSQIPLTQSLEEEKIDVRMMVKGETRFFAEHRRGKRITVKLSGTKDFNWTEPEYGFG